MLKYLQNQIHMRTNKRYITRGVPYPKCNIEMLTLIHIVSSFTSFSLIRTRIIVVLNVRVAHFISLKVMKFI